MSQQAGCRSSSAQTPPRLGEARSYSARTVPRLSEARSFSGRTLHSAHTLPRLGGARAAAVSPRSRRPGHVSESLPTLDNAFAHFSRRPELTVSLLERAESGRRGGLVFDDDGGAEMKVAARGHVLRVPTLEDDQAEVRRAEARAIRRASDRRESRTAGCWLCRDSDDDDDYEKEKEKEKRRRARRSEGRQGRVRRLFAAVFLSGGRGGGGASHADRPPVPAPIPAPEDAWPALVGGRRGPASPG